MYVSKHSDLFENVFSVVEIDFHQSRSSKDIMQSHQDTMRKGVYMKL